MSLEYCDVASFALPAEWFSDTKACTFSLASEGNVYSNKITPLYNDIQIDLLKLWVRLCFSLFFFLVLVRHLRPKYLTVTYFSISLWLIISFLFSIPHPYYCPTCPKSYFSYLQPICPHRFLFHNIWKSDFLCLPILFQHLSPLSPTPQRVTRMCPHPALGWGALLSSAFLPVLGFKSSFVMVYF